MVAIFGHPQQEAERLRAPQALGQSRSDIRRSARKGLIDRHVVGMAVGDLNSRACLHCEDGAGQGQGRRERGRHPYQSAGHDDHAPRRRRLEDRAPARRPDHDGSTSRINHSAVAQQDRQTGFVRARVRAACVLVLLTRSKKILGTGSGCVREFTHQAQFPVPRAQNFLELAIGAAPTAAHQVPRILFAGRRVIIFPGSQ